MTPPQKISVIERSLRCAVYGWFSLIPLIGLVMAVLAFRDIAFVRKICGTEWNPAHAKLTWGKFLAWAGLIISLLTLCFIIYAVFD